VLGSPGLPSEASIGAAGNVPKPQPQHVPISEMEPPKDWPGWKKAWFKVGRGEMTAIAGTVGLAKKAYDDPEKIPGGFANLGSNIYHHPGDTAKALADYDDLANGRPFDWFGNIGITVLSGGAGGTAARGTRLTRVIGSPKLERLGPNAPRWGGAFAGRKVDFSKPDLGARSGTSPRIPLNREDLAAAYPRGVRFTRAGYPVFTPHSVERVRVDGLDGFMRNDEPLANKAAGLKETPDGYTWHHVEDGKTMELVPTDVHRAVQHTGGRAAMPNQLNAVTPGSAFTPFERAVGGAGAGGGVAATSGGSGP
jgi:hypothetical protein